MAAPSLKETFNTVAQVTRFELLADIHTQLLASLLAPCTLNIKMFMMAQNKLVTLQFEL